MRTIYCIPGLGASPAIFSKLNLHRAELRPLLLPMPAPHEVIHSYTLRLLELIDDAGPFWLLGQSFGGILAIELARLRLPEKLILVSSIKSRTELPWYGRLIGSLRLHRLAPLSHAEYTMRVSAFLNGIKSAEDRALLKAMVEEHDLNLLKWSLDQTLKWPGCATPANLVHIHGTADRIIPARYVNPDIWIDGGTHFMIVTRAVEISALIDGMVAAESA